MWSQHLSCSPKTSICCRLLQYGYFRKPFLRKLNYPSSIYNSYQAFKIPAHLLQLLGRVITILLIIFLSMNITGISVWNSNDNLWAQVQADRILVDNFDEPMRQNPQKNSRHGAFADERSLGECYVFFYGGADRVFGGNGYSMHIQWDTSKPGAYGGYWNELKHLNLENYNYLTFYIKGFNGGETLKIGLRGKEDAQYETKILINDALKTGVSTEWQKVVIPLKWFKAVESWRAVSVFSLNFEHAFGSGKGQILIDEIAFEK